MSSPPPVFGNLCGVSDRCQMGIRQVSDSCQHSNAAATVSDWCHIGKIGVRYLITKRCVVRRVHKLAVTPHGAVSLMAATPQKYVRWLMTTADVKMVSVAGKPRCQLGVRRVSEGCQMDIL